MKFTKVYPLTEKKQIHQNHIMKPLPKGSSELSKVFELIQKFCSNKNKVLLFTPYGAFCTDNREVINKNYAKGLKGNSQLFHVSVPPLSKNEHSPSCEIALGPRSENKV